MLLTAAKILSKYGGDSNLSMPFIEEAPNLPDKQQSSEDLWTNLKYQE